MSAWGSKVNRIDQPQPGLLALTVYTDGRSETLVVSMLPGALELGIVERRPRGDRAIPSISNLRRHIEGARVVDVEVSRRAARITLSRAGERRELIVTPAKPLGAWWLLGAEGESLVRSPGAVGDAPDEASHFAQVTPDGLRDRGRAVFDAHRGARLRQLQRALARELKRVRKKRAAVAGDLERANEAATLREQANLLLAHAHEIPDGTRSFDAPSFEAPEKRVRIALHDGRSATEEARALFEKAKRLKRATRIVPERLDAVDDRLEKLEALARELEDASPEVAADALAALGVAIEEPRERERKKRQAGTRVPYREFVSESGTAVLVGRGAADNDRLTLRVARPHDLWLHARGVTGAHVVVRLDKGEACPSEVLVDAATLSAHYSDLRGEAVVDVLYTPRRYVRKSKGSPVGSVTLEREKVIAVRLEPERLARLLASERKTGA